MMGGSCDITLRRFAPRRREVEDCIKDISRTSLPRAHKCIQTQLRSAVTRHHVKRSTLELEWLQQQVVLDLPQEACILKPPGDGSPGKRVDCQNDTLPCGMAVEAGRSTMTMLTINCQTSQPGKHAKEQEKCNTLKALHRSTGIS